MPPETIARAGEGDDGRHARLRRASASRTPATRADEQRPSMGQDMLKGRRTEIEFLNGLVVARRREARHRLPRQRRAHRHRQARRARRAHRRPPPHHRAAVELKAGRRAAAKEKGPAPGPFLHSRCVSAAYHLFLMLTEMMSALWSASPTSVTESREVEPVDRRVVEEDVGVGEVERHLVRPLIGRAAADPPAVAVRHCSRRSRGVLDRATSRRPRRVRSVSFWL